MFRHRSAPVGVLLGAIALLTTLVLAATPGAAPSAYAQARVDDSYRPPASGDTGRPPVSDSYRGPATADRYGSPTPPPPPPAGAGPDTGGRSGYGAPYSPPPVAYESAPRPKDDDRRFPSTYEQGEIVERGRGFFGAVSQGLANAIEHTYKRSGRPNGYILGEDAGGAIFAGLRYGEGTLYTKDAGDHRVFWQGPSLGYDLGGEGSKVMILAYNLASPDDVYERFGGVEGSAYLVGGVSVQYQKHRDVTLAVIRSGVGLRLGANVGYSKYTRRPTWNPF